MLRSGGSFKKFGRFLFLARQSPCQVLDVPLTAKVMLPDVDQDPWCMAYAAKHGVEAPLCSNADVRFPAC
eukprot:329257-Amphidinium_carterae.1